MGKIIPFPVKFIPPPAGNSAGKSDMQYVIDKLIIQCKSAGRSQGFLIGSISANLIHLIIQYCTR